ncbi:MULTISPECIES: protein kinase domain-containing protein [Nostoc]|uniref:non-specific serine/threonine protein kinase n=1 Tax=Nostoc paludosum FACHB-159 TaxID=2692908 RepID=A0ABR8KJC4_9NOSO|nr:MULTISPECIES: protein kinase [Nostoc]MBD2682641.1 protein kinase [Nostoc sp. FACHB-857]MBD2738974.1 protein kinase [Nostoc paludosum FACHB-159]
MVYSPNFQFLSTHEVYLVEIATLAERYFKDDPLACLTKLRRFGELLAQLVAAKLGIYVKSDEEQYRLLRRLKQDACIPHEVYQLFEHIRKIGNQAVHEDRGDHQTALDTLQIAWKLAIWFDKTFNNNSNFEVGAFIPPPDPLEETEALKKQLEILRQEAQANYATAELAQAQLVQEAELRQLAEHEAQQERLNVERVKQQLEQMQLSARNRSVGSLQKTQVLMSQTATKLNLKNIKPPTSIKTFRLCLNPNCSYENFPDTNFCINCGSSLILNGRYIPIRCLGEGGFGRTFEAIDIKKLDEHCVIKQLLPSQQGTNNKKTFLELFEREAQQLNNLGKHPNIPNLLAFFGENEYYYLIQEFIDGNNLRQEILQVGQFSEEQIKIFLKELLKIIQFVHEKKVIHRDIKPENIIKRQNGTFVLIDFGVSKNISLGSGISSYSATVVASSGYTPNEQFQGQVYPCSDIYALGLTAIRLLTGILPGNGNNDILFDVNNNTWDWKKYCKVSNNLAKILDKMIAFSCQDRYQTVTEVIEELAILDAKKELPVEVKPRWKQILLSPKIVLLLVSILTMLIFYGVIITQVKTQLNKLLPTSHKTDITSQNGSIIVGKIKQYKSEKGQLFFTLITAENQTYLIAITPNILNQVANAPPPYGLVGKTVNVTKVQPLVENNQLLLQIQKPEQLQIN